MARPVLKLNNLKWISIFFIFIGCTEYNLNQPVYYKTQIESDFYEQACGEVVRINIGGYPEIKYFEIHLPRSTDVIFDGKNVDTQKLSIYPLENMAAVEESKIGFTRILIKNDKQTAFFSSDGEQLFKGDFDLIIKENKLSIINSVDRDHYFTAVLGAEMGESFSEQALKAQAVLIRTYYYKRKSKYQDLGYDINSLDGKDMVYRGTEFTSPSLYKLIKQTDNLVLLDQAGNLVLPLFHSTSGGIILQDKVLSSRIEAPIENPVLLYDVDENGQILSRESPYYEFEQSIEFLALEKIINQVIEIKDIEDIKLKFFEGTPCVDFIGFIDSNNKTEWIKAYKFVSLAQQNDFKHLRSIQFTVNKQEDGFIFTGNGFGHLCGMSQYSAQAMALQGYDFEQILKRYYPHYELAILKDINTALALPTTQK